MNIRGAVLGVAMACVAMASQAAEPRSHVKSLKITVLSTMLADRGIGEWGFAALVEVDGKRFLFDTGARPETVLANAREMRIDLSNIEDAIISHNHGDHTGGLLTLRRELQKTNPRALSRVHVGEGITLSRPITGDGRRGDGEGNGLLPLQAEYEATGGRLVIYKKTGELAPGVFVTGPVPRTYPEKNYPQGGKIKLATGEVDDTIPEDSSMVFATDEGLVVLTGCGHAGIVNTVEYARQVVEPLPVLAIVGGLHTFAASDENLAWTAQKLKAANLRHLLAAHCTGIEATFRLRQLVGLDRKTAVVSAVGSSFTLGKGIDPLALAR